MTSRLIQLAAAASGVYLSAAASGQVTVRQIEVDTPAGMARGLVAEVDLSDPRVVIRVVADRASSGQLGSFALLDTRGCAAREETELAVNANFFAAKPDGTADIIGLCVVDGEEISPARVHQGRGDPVLVFFDDGTAAVTAGEPERAGVTVTHAVAGVGGSATSDVAGTLLVQDGENLGASARVQPKARHPRTAAGVSADGTRLYLIVIDGRQPGWSVGATLPELAHLLIEMGADDALNLDGGGSSSFVGFRGDELEQNRPSDGGFRPVAVSLGVDVADDVDEEREPVERAG